MKKIIFLLFIGLISASFSSYIINEFEVSGIVNGIENGTKVKLQTQDEQKGLKIVDSTTIINGKFSFKGTADEPSIHVIQIDKVQGGIPLFIEKGKINITIDKDSISKSVVGGTKNNIDLQKFNTDIQVYQTKMQEYQKLNMQKFQEAQSSQDSVLMNKLMKDYNVLQANVENFTKSYPEKNPTSFISVLIVDNLFNYPNADIESIKNTYAKLDETLKNSKPGKSIQSKIANFKSINIGDKAPDFSAPNPEGKVISLKESLGKVTIIDFWASWCGPCRKENPSVVALYNELHSKGLNIIGVSLDKTVADWQKAITKDNITWSQVSNLKFWDDPIAKLYKVEQIPTVYLLDKDGKIVAKDLRGAELKAKILELLNKK